MERRFLVSTDGADGRARELLSDRAKSTQSACGRTPWSGRTRTEFGGQNRPEQSATQVVE